MKRESETYASRDCLSVFMLREAVKCYIEAFSKGGKYTGEPWVLQQYAQLDGFLRLVATRPGRDQLPTT